MDKFKLALLATIDEQYARVEAWADRIPYSDEWQDKLSREDWDEVVAELTALESQLDA